MALNSPWLDLQAPLLIRTAGTAVLNQVGARQPMREIPRNVSGLYTRSLHRDHEGEWDFNLVWKPVESWPVYAGWLRAIRTGHARLHAGLDVRCPVLVLSLGRQRASRSEMGDDVHRHDIVLDVPRSAGGRRPSAGTSRSSPSRTPATTWCSPCPDVRKVVYDEIDRWVSAYVD